MLTLIIITSILAYIFLGGVIGGVWYKYFTKECGCSGRDFCYVDHESAAVMIGIFWPIGPPLVLLTVLLWVSISTSVSFLVNKIIK